MKYYFIIINNKQLGPLTVEQLAAVGVKADTPVWNEGLPDWTPAGEVPELNTIVGANADNNSGEQSGGYSGTMPPKWTGMPQAAQTAPPAVPAKPRKRHTGWWVAAACLTALVIAMAVTCPDKKDHERAIASVAKEWMGDKLDSWGANGMLGTMFRMLGGVGADYAIDEMLDVDDYFSWSVGHVTVGNEQYRTSVGIMGHVFTFNKEQIDDAFNEWVGITSKDAKDEAEKAEVAARAEQSYRHPAPAPDYADEDEDGTATAPYYGRDNDGEEMERQPFDNFVDTITGHIKREGKEWLKRLIDSL